MGEIIVGEAQSPIPPSTTTPVLIPPELERALFIKFWTWLGIVGTLIIAAVAAISVLVSQTLLLTAKSTSETAVDARLKTMSDRIDNIDISARASLQKSSELFGGMQELMNSIKNRSKEADDSLIKIRSIAESSIALSANAQTVDEISNKLSASDGFRKIVVGKLDIQLKELTQLLTISNN